MTLWGLRAGHCKTVEFDFDLGADTAMSVASEMVEDLSLSHEDAQVSCGASAFRVPFFVTSLLAWMCYSAGLPVSCMHMLWCGSYSFGRCQLQISVWPHISKRLANSRKCAADDCARDQERDPCADGQRA